jgi:hypothetical protein
MRTPISSPPSKTIERNRLSSSLALLTYASVADWSKHIRPIICEYIRIDVSEQYNPETRSYVSIGPDERG